MTDAPMKIEAMTGHALKMIRGRLGMTQGQLATAIGNQSGSGARRVRRYERGELTIPPQVALKIRNLMPEDA